MPENADSLDAIIGEEFLTWLWFRSDVAPDSFADSNGAPFNVVMEQRIVVQGGLGNARETASVSGALSPLREARFGLCTGKKVSRAIIRLEKDGMEFQLLLRAEDFCLGGVKTPKVDRNDSDDEPDAMLLEKIYLLELCIRLLDQLYHDFLKLRLSKDWTGTVMEIGKWLGKTE